MDRTPYELELEVKTDSGGEIYSFSSKDGIHSKKSFRDPELLIADEIDPDIDEDILVFKPGFGFLGVAMGKKAPEGETLLAGLSDRSRQVSEINLKRNSVKNAGSVTVSSPGRLDRKFDKILYAPRQYDPIDLVKSQMIQLSNLLKQEGELIFCGTRESGIKRYREFLNDRKGDLKKVAERKANRLYCFRPETRIEDEVEIEHEFSAAVDQVSCRFRTCKGLFSARKIDRGTRLLVEEIDIGDGEKVLDLGCGYGAIGVFLAKKQRCQLMLSDDSALAVEYARKNLRSNQVEDYRVETADCLDGFDNERFDSIVSNPPTHEGKAVTEEMIEKSFRKLVKGGKLFMVFQKETGLKQKIEQEFGATRIRVREDGYLIAEAMKN